jgi:hypothetical protein
MVELVAEQRQAMERLNPFVTAAAVLAFSESNGEDPLALTAEDISVNCESMRNLNEEYRRRLAELAISFRAAALAVAKEVARREFLLAAAKDMAFRVDAHPHILIPAEMLSTVGVDPMDLAGLLTLIPDEEVPPPNPAPPPPPPSDPVLPPPDKTSLNNADLLAARLMYLLEAGAITKIRMVAAIIEFFDALPADDRPKEAVADCFTARCIFDFLVNHAFPKGKNPHGILFDSTSPKKIGRKMKVVEEVPRPQGGSRFKHYRLTEAGRTDYQARMLPLLRASAADLPMTIEEMKKK